MVQRSPGKGLCSMWSRKVKNPQGKKVLLNARPRAQVASSCCNSGKQLISQKSPEKPRQGAVLSAAKEGKILLGPGPVALGAKNSLLTLDQGTSGIFTLKKKHLIAARAAGRNFSKMAQRSPGKGLYSMLQKKAKNPLGTSANMPRGRKNPS